MSSSVHVDNKEKVVLILGEGPTQGLDNTALIEEGKYLINFTQPEKRIALGLHSNVYTIMEATVSYLLTLQKYFNSRQKTMK